MNRLYYNTVYNPCNKNNSSKNVHSSISTGYPWLTNQMLPLMTNNSIPLKNPYFGSGDYSNIMNTAFTTNVTTTLSNKTERLPVVRSPSKNDGIDGYRIYSRSTMVEIAWQYDLKQWKEILGQNQSNDFGILLILQKEKKTCIDNYVDESVDSGCVNDSPNNSSYFNYLTQSSAYSTNYKNHGDGKSLISNSPSIPYYNDFSYNPYNRNNGSSFKEASNEVCFNKLQKFCKPKITSSNYGLKYPYLKYNTSKSPETQRLWTSAYSNLLYNDSDNSEANVYKMFLDKLVKQMTIKSYKSSNKEKNSQTTITRLSEEKNKHFTYTRNEMLKISERYTTEEWIKYLLDNFSNNNIVMGHLRKDIFTVDSNPMRPKMSREVKAIFRKYKNKKKNVEEKKKN
ncbi:Hypothetical protein SRAE_1000096900 [Strongyloides ratti]|uniref:LysM domain-containing protein n=1 Tax=Strongyloides ratti TaxID=34506 RepID=A0A090L5H3_STRRB|nr:Hypothetical protein SRAE_1000096900 [Strongyloides ratti]CEF62699.1 Hypothetical protein SRAE_1000096900 [Strongyloides ratti]